MTKKDYELIADAIKKTEHYCIANNNAQGFTIIDGIQATEYLKRVLKVKLTRDNPCFDYKKFEEATRGFLSQAV